MTCHVKDIAGLGEIIGHLTQILLRFFEYRTTREERDLVNRRLYINNLRALLEIARDFGLSAEELSSWKTVLEQERQQLLSVECAHCRAKGAQPFMRANKHGIVSVDG